MDENGCPTKVDNKFVYKDKTEEELIESCDFFMNDILTSCNCEGYIAFIKGKGNYRYAINPEYKANRPKESPWWWKIVKNYLITKWKAIEVNGLEVDDACKITNINTKDSFIVAIDQDLLWLKGVHFNWRKKEWTTTNQTLAIWKFWEDMIKGQPGDNLKGIPGKGPKYFEIIVKYKTNDMFPSIVLKAYIDHFGEQKGINEFYKTYNSLYILDKYEGFVIPEVSEFKK